MDPSNYTYEDITTIIFKGERRGFMAGVIFCTIIYAYREKVKEGRLWTKRSDIPGCEH